MAENNKKVIIHISEQLLEKIEDYRFAERMPNRMEAVRQLIQGALEAWEANKPAGAETPAATPKSRRTKSPA